MEELKAALRRSGTASRYDWEDDCYDFSKFYLASDEKSRPRELFGRLKDIEAIDRGDGYYECVPRGHSKATAMDLVDVYKRQGKRRITGSRWSGSGLRARCFGAFPMT